MTAQTKEKPQPCHGDWIDWLGVGIIGFAIVAATIGIVFGEKPGE